MVMNLIKCLICNKEVKEGSVCSQCGNANLAVFKKSKVFYKDKTYSQRKWYLFLTPYSKNGKEKIIAKHRIEKISYDYLYEIFISNCKKHTFIGQILPAIVFLGIACTNILMAVIGINHSNLVIDGSEYNIKSFFYFLGVLYFSFFIIVFYLGVIKKQRCYIATVKGQTRYVCITKEKYGEIIEDYKSLKDKNELGEF